MSAWMCGVRVVLAGGSGLLGRRIAEDLGASGHDLVILTGRPNSRLKVRQVVWDGDSVGDWACELEGPDTALINLAGKLVDCRPTARNIAELRRSRVLPTRALVQASTQLMAPPGALGTGQHHGDLVGCR
jgi:uncharacterized protein